MSIGVFFDQYIEQSSFIGCLGNEIDKYYEYLDTTHNDLHADKAGDEYIDEHRDEHKDKHEDEH